MNVLVRKKIDAQQSVSAVAVLACAWPALLLATVCLVPFLNKAFLTDDPWFLMMAKQIVKHPAHPMDFEICWNNWHECRNAYQFASGNALIGQVALGYVLVPTVLGGAHEWMAHLTQLVLVWIAVVAMTSLIFRFGWNRWHATVGASAPGGHPTFSPHGQHCNARYSCDRSRASSNGTACSVEGRSRSGAKARQPLLR